MNIMIIAYFVIMSLFYQYEIIVDLLELIKSNIYKYDCMICIIIVGLLKHLFDIYEILNSTPIFVELYSTDG